MGVRHRGREYALQILFALDHNEKTDFYDIRKTFWQGTRAPAEVRAFAELLVGGMLENREQIDDLIVRTSENWRLDRMNGVDRNVLRMAAFELLFLDDIPISVTINEAVEIGKKFGSEESGAFINGILDRIAREFEGRKAV